MADPGFVYELPVWRCLR